MTVALAASADGELGHGRIVVAEMLHLRVKLAVATVARVELALEGAHRMMMMMLKERAICSNSGGRLSQTRVEEERRDEAVEDDLDIGGGDPVLEHGACVELVEGGSRLQRAEADAVGVERRRLQMSVGADGLLLVGGGDAGAHRPTEDALALARVELKGHPRLAVVHALEDGERVGLDARAKLHADVGELVLLAKGDVQRDVGRLRRVVDGRRHPARGVRRRLHVRQVACRLHVGLVAHAALLLLLLLLLLVEWRRGRRAERERLASTCPVEWRRLGAVGHGRLPARARRGHLLTVGDVLERRYAALSDARETVVARVVVVAHAGTTAGERVESRVVASRRVVHHHLDFVGRVDDELWWLLLLLLDGHVVVVVVDDHVVQWTEVALRVDDGH